MTDVELTLLSLCYQWRSGRELQQMYEKETGRKIGSGNLYSAIRNLLEWELIEARQCQDEDGRFRKFKITSKGSRNRRDRQREQEPTPSPILRPSRA